MATKETVTRTCDSCGYEDQPDGDNVKTQILGMNNLTYEAELCTECTIHHSSWLSQVGRLIATTANGKRTLAMRRETKAIRAWAISNAKITEPKGRIPGTVVTEWRKLPKTEQDKWYA